MQTREFPYKSPFNAKFKWRRDARSKDYSCEYLGKRLILMIDLLHLHHQCKYCIHYTGTLQPLISAVNKTTPQLAPCQVDYKPIYKSMSWIFSGCTTTVGCNGTAKKGLPGSDCSETSRGSRLWLFVHVSVKRLRRYGKSQ
jgi:hypothetical protein